MKKKKKNYKAKKYQIKQLKKENNCMENKVL